MEKLITNEICLNILKQCYISGADNEQLTIEKFHITKFSEEQKGFMGEHFNLDIHTNNNQNSYTFFIKSKPLLLPSFQSYVNELGIFTKETKLYKTLLEVLRKLSTHKWCPKCYYIFENDAIIMENLILKGYKIYNHREYFNYNQVKALIKTMASFHATSIIYEELTRQNTKVKDFRIPDKYGDLMIESAYYNDQIHIRSKWLISNTEAFITVIKHLNHFHSTNETLIREKLMHLPDLLKSATNYRKVMNHGDLWCNNIMFHEDNEHGLSCVLVDFQFCRYSSPAQDIMLALFTTTNREFRQKYYKHFINMYYDMLGMELSRYSLNINDVYPKDEYLYSCHEYRVIGILEAAIFTMLIYYRSDDIDYMYGNAEKFFTVNLGNKNEFVLNIFQNDQHLQERVSDIYEDIVEYVL